MDKRLRVLQEELEVPVVIRSTGRVEVLNDIDGLRVTEWFELVLPQEERESLQDLAADTLSLLDLGDGAQRDLAVRILKSFGFTEKERELWLSERKDPVRSVSRG